MAEIIVLKFGGESIRSIARLKKVAQKIFDKYREGNKVVVVVSAMGDRTDDLLKKAERLNKNPPARELVMLLTAGEREAIGLLSIRLAKLGLNAVSFTGSQIGILTDEFLDNAKILAIHGQRLKAALRAKKIPIVAGFQGVSFNREITTLGRGGSDITAVALAAYLKANVCELFKDVPGIFTENPHEFPSSRRIPEITYDELMELTSVGEKPIIAPRACALGAKYRVPIFIKPFFDNKKEETVVKFERPISEEVKVRAITHKRNLCRLTMISVPQVPRCLSQVVTRLSKAKIPVLFFSHGVPSLRESKEASFDLSFIVSQGFYRKALKVLKTLQKAVRAKRLIAETGICSVSLIGTGIGSDLATIARFFSVLQKLTVHLDAFTTSELRITGFLREKDLNRTVGELLKEYNLVEP